MGNPEDTIQRDNGTARPRADAQTSWLARPLPLAAVLLVAYGWCFAWFPALRSPNELSRLYETRAIVRDHVLAIDGEIRRHGAVGDLATKDGRHFAAKAPGISLLSIPAYAAVAAARGGHDAVTERAALFFARLLACTIPGVLAAVAIRALMRSWFEEDMATAGAIVFALGTLMWPYSTQLVGHATTTAALIASWYGIERARSSDALRWPILAGMSAASAVAIEYTSALIVPALILYAILTVRNLGRTALASLLASIPPLVLLAVIHARMFGNPIATPYSYMADPVYVLWHSRGLMGFARPDARVLAISFFDPARGLFVYAPFLVLGIPGLFALWRRDRALALLCATVIVLYALFTAGFTLPAWGWSIGPRHLTPLCAFLIVPAVALAEDLRSRGIGFVPAALAGYSFVAFALIVAVCPYFPAELTNPLSQLVIPFATAGLHVADVIGLATGAHRWWTLLPWALAVAALAITALRSLSAASPVRPAAVFVALALAIAFASYVTHAGGPDRFDATRRYMLSRYEPIGPSSSMLFRP